MSTIKSMPFWHFLCISIRFGDLQKAKTPVLVISFGVSLKKGHNLHPGLLFYTFRPGDADPNLLFMVPMPENTLI